MLMRLTSDDQECIVRHLNIFFAENGKGYIRSGGADNQDIEEITWIREAAKNIGAELCSKDDEGLCDELYDNLQYGIEIPEGVIAYLYIAVQQAIEMRGRLKRVENILGDTYDLSRLRELVQADKEGRCVVLPCKIGDPVYMATGRYRITGYVEDICDGFYIDRTGKLQIKTQNYTGNHGTYGSLEDGSVQLTRAAAEKALEEMEVKENG